MLKINCAWSDNENKMREDMAVTLAIMLEAAGAKRVNSFNANSPPRLCIHEMVTARTGRDLNQVKRAVTNRVKKLPNGLAATNG